MKLGKLFLFILPLTLCTFILLSFPDYSVSKTEQKSLTPCQVKKILKAGRCFVGSNLSELGLSEWDLSKIDGYHVDLSNSDLSNAKLSDASLMSSTLNNANLKNADFQGANLKGADFTGCNIRLIKNLEKAKNTEKAKGLNHKGVRHKAQGRGQ